MCIYMYKSVCEYMYVCICINVLCVVYCVYKCVYTLSYEQLFWATASISANSASRAYSPERAGMTNSITRSFLPHPLPTSQDQCDPLGFCTAPCGLTQPVLMTKPCLPRRERQSNSRGGQACSPLNHGIPVASSCLGRRRPFAEGSKPCYAGSPWGSTVFFGF